MNLDIILEIVLIIIGLYLALFKSYFQEKGKNIATSEDIEDLTLKVESVKQQFLEKNATLKAKLDLLTNLQLSHKNDERLAIINFHKKFKSWIGSLSESSPSLVNDYDNVEIQAKIHSYNAIYQEVLSAEALLELYVDDKKLFELISDLKIKTIENLVPHPPKTLIDLKLNNINIELLEKEQDPEKKIARHKELMAERQGIYERYSENMIAGYKLNVPVDNAYTKYIKEYLANISDE
jgi:hypothetical protein